MVARLCGEITSPSPHTAAYALIGLAHASSSGLDTHRQLAEDLVALLRAGHDAESRPGWDWFEPVLGYDCARLSQALIVGGRLVDDAAATELGLRTLTWLGDECGLEGALRPAARERRTASRPTAPRLGRRAADRRRRPGGGRDRRLADDR